VIAAIAVLLFGMLVSFYLLKRQTISNYQKYPPTTDCDSILKMFKGNFSDPIFKSFAQSDLKNTENEKGVGIF
jgi:hypothetical protein